MFLVTGITGHVGGAAARQLLKTGRAVRALVRDPARAASWAAQGVDVRKGDFTDAPSLAAALDGVEGAFLMMPPQNPTERGFPEVHAITASYRAALGHASERAPLPRVVVLSSWGCDKPDRLGLIAAARSFEDALRDVAAPLAVIRAGSFLENHASSLAAAAKTGAYATYLAPLDRATPYVATEDIGQLAARALAGDAWRGTRIFELGTPYTPDDIARALADVIGKPVAARSIPRDQWRAGLLARGMPTVAAELFEEMEDSVNSGWIAFGAPGAERVPGTITPREFFERVRAGA